MPKLLIKISELRETTFDIIEKYVCSGKFLSYKSTVKHFYNLCRQKNQSCGFDLSDFDKFYKNYMRYRTNQIRQNTTKFNNEKIIKQILSGT